MHAYLTILNNAAIDNYKYVIFFRILRLKKFKNSIRFKKKNWIKHTILYHDPGYSRNDKKHLQHCINIVALAIEILKYTFFLYIYFLTNTKNFINNVNSYSC